MYLTFSSRTRVGYVFHFSDQFQIILVLCSKITCHDWLCRKDTHTCQAATVNLAQCPLVCLVTPVLVHAVHLTTLLSLVDGPESRPPSSGSGEVQVERPVVDFRYDRWSTMDIHRAILFHLITYRTWGVIETERWKGRKKECIAMHIFWLQAATDIKYTKDFAPLFFIEE